MQGIEMEAKKVVVRDYSGSPVLCRVREVAHGFVYVWSQEEYAKCRAGHDSAPPIGIPAVDVYLCDAQVEEWVRTRHAVPWDQMQRYKGSDSCTQ
jgi:hypothetical protein